MQKTIDIINAAIKAEHSDVLAKVCKTRDRHAILVPELIKLYGGNALEIGAHEGLTTAVYLSSGAGAVYVVDPYNGEQQGTDAAYEAFLANTLEHGDKLRFLKASSGELRGVEFIRTAENLTFAFVDGLHKHAAAKYDIENCIVAKAKVICVDDVKGYWQFSGHVLAAVHEAVKNTEYRIIYTPENIQELYLVRGDCI